MTLSMLMLCSPRIQSLNMCKSQFFATRTCNDKYKFNHWYMKQAAKVSVHVANSKHVFKSSALLVDFDFSKILKVNLLLRYLKSFDQVPQELPWNVSFTFSCVDANEFSYCMFKYPQLLQYFYHKKT